MSTAIIKFEADPNQMYYCASDSYPAGIGFDLLKIRDNGGKRFVEFLASDPKRFSKVESVPTDIQYEYIIKSDGDIHCQECWYTADKNYHGGGFRHGGTYNLNEWRDKMMREQELAYRLPEYWKNEK